MSNWNFPALESKDSEDKQTTSVLYVDGQKLVRGAITKLVNEQADQKVRIVGEANNYQEALERIEELNPGIVLLEIDLPGPSGLELLYELRRRKIENKTAVLSHIKDLPTVNQALTIGAIAYILKSASLPDLIVALLKVSNGKRYVSPEISADLDISKIKRSSSLQIEKIYDPLEPLSPREREIFNLLAGGLQNTDIAKQLYISPRTVETHRARVVRKLGLSSNAEIIRFAIKHGLAVV